MLRGKYWRARPLPFSLLPRCHAGKIREMTPKEQAELTRAVAHALDLPAKGASFQASLDDVRPIASAGSVRC